MECKFQVGQKIVCLTVAGIYPHRETLPSPGLVYTVRNVLVDSDGIPCIRLKEIVNEPRMFIEGFVEAAFPADRFRPIHETQIEELRQAAIKAAREAKAPRKSRAGQPMAPVGFMR